MYDNITRRNTASSEKSNGSLAPLESSIDESEDFQCHHAVGICSKIIHTINAWPKIKSIKLKNETASPGCAYNPTEVSGLKF